MLTAGCTHFARTKSCWLNAKLVMEFGYSLALAKLNKRITNRCLLLHSFIFISPISSGIHLEDYPEKK